MPKLNSIELKHKRMILNWAGKAWPRLKEASKVKIWCAIYSKEVPTKVIGAGDDGEIVIKVVKADASNVSAPRFAVPDLQ